MMPTMKEIDKEHDGLFKKTFGDVENTRAFLSMALPQPLRKAVDLYGMEIDTINYVSVEFEELFSDIVVKTRIKENSGFLDADIYIILERRCCREAFTYVQFLRYMYRKWQKDVEEDEPLRVIIPLVFYHGEKKWNIPQSCDGQFDADDDVTGFLLDYRYVLFDTRERSFFHKFNKKLIPNTFFLNALILWDEAFQIGSDMFYEIIELWRGKALVDDKERLAFLILYILEMINAGPEDLTQAWNKEKLETARNLLKLGIDIDKIAKATGLKKAELKKLASTSH
jgi:predicted transposase YdaD